MPAHNYIFVPTREPWPASSVNARVPSPVDKLSAAAWLDRNKPVEQMTWAPGESTIIRDRLMSEGGWLTYKAATVLNLYRPPVITLGNAAEADRWSDHVHKVYPDNADHIIRWCAQRVQRPDVKVNHALVLGGAQGIGKDTLLEPVKRAIGAWNFCEVTPQHLLGRFNGYLKSVILRISEARDLGEYDRYKFYDHTKSYIAAPPDVLRCDEKHLREHSVPNLCGVIITTNHKTDGIFLPAGDRRHYVAWSDLTENDFVDDYWTGLWHWYDHGGDRHVAAFLAELDIAEFDPKAPPPKTSAFWEIVHASRAPEDDEMQDAIDAINTINTDGAPNVLTLDQIAAHAAPDFYEYLRDRKNARRIPHRLEACGYVAVRNDATKDGRWKVNSKNQTIYGKVSLSVRDRIAAATGLAAGLAAG